MHIEPVCQELNSPSGVNREIRIYVDGVLQVRGHTLGRLGVNVTTLPAVTVLADDLLVTVGAVHWEEPLRS